MAGLGYFVQGLSGGLMSGRADKLEREKLAYARKIAESNAARQLIEQKQSDWKFNQLQSEMAAKKAAEAAQIKLYGGLMGDMPQGLPFGSYKSAYDQQQANEAQLSQARQAAKLLNLDGNISQPIDKSILNTAARNKQLSLNRSAGLKSDQLKDQKQIQSSLITGLSLGYSKEEATKFALSGMTPNNIISMSKMTKNDIDKKYAPSNLKKLIREKKELIDQGLPEDHPYVQAYDDKITGVDIDIDNMTQDEIDTWGAYFNVSGKIPSLGRGKQSTKIRVAIAKSAARQALDANDSKLLKGDPKKTPIDAAFSMLGKQSDTKAIQGSLNFLEKQLGSMGSFVTNLNSQIDRVGELSKDLYSFDTRLLNIPLRAVRGKIAGSALQSKYDMFLSEIESEIGKLATGSTASIAELSATAQDKWSKIHDKNLSVSDMLSLLEETKNAANFRYNSVQNQLNRTREKMLKRDFEKLNTTKDVGNDPLGIRQ